MSTVFIAHQNMNKQSCIKSTLGGMYEPNNWNLSGKSFPYTRHPSYDKETKQVTNLYFSGQIETCNFQLLGSGALDMLEL
jgi:hypothetical protein